MKDFIVQNFNADKYFFEPVNGVTADVNLFLIIFGDCQPNYTSLSEKAGNTGWQDIFGKWKVKGIIS